jgi:hypothetical protein
VSELALEEGIERLRWGVGWAMEGREKLDQSLVFIKFGPTYYIKFDYFIVYLNLGIKDYKNWGGAMAPIAPTPGYTPGPKHGTMPSSRTRAC